MSHSIPVCPKCQQAMQAGFMVDRTHGANLQGSWVPGEARQTKIFGMSTGVAIDEKRVHPVTCYRCMSCCYLEYYAYPLPTEEAETMLLRPAQGATLEEPEQLLRGSSRDES